MDAYLSCLFYLWNFTLLLLRFSFNYFLKLFFFLLSSFWFRVCVFPDRVLDLLSAFVFLFCSLQDLFFDVFRFFFAFIFKVVLLCDLFVISYFASWLVINICGDGVYACMYV